MDTSSFNPYHPPSERSSDASLADDTAFLFNDRVVAGGGTIVLPKVCVVIGSTDLLLARESRLWWCNRWLTNSRDVMLLATMYIGIPMLMNLPPMTPGLRGSLEISALLQLTSGSGAILGAVALVIATLNSRTSIQVRWHISRRAAARSLYRNVFHLVIATGILISMITQVAVRTTYFSICSIC